MTSLYEFTWAVPHQGFTWSHAIALEPSPDEAEWGEILRPVGEPHRFLRHAVESWDEPSGTPPPTVYRIFQDHPALFRRFAELPTPYVDFGTFEQSGRDPEIDAARAAFQAATLDFSGRFGWLGVGAFLAQPDELDGAPTRFRGERRTVGEAEEVWGSHILTMRGAIELWQAAASNDHELLSRRFRLEGEGGQGTVMYLAPDDEAWGGTGVPSVDESLPMAVVDATGITMDEDLVSSARQGDFRPAALAETQATVNYSLEQHCSPRLLRDGTRTRLQIFPQNLIGALWLQLAMAIDGDKDYRRCDECGEWFEVSPDTARTNRRYCSDRCRVKAYRGRQAKARDLAAAGKPIDEIAIEIGSNASTVAGWIERGGKQ